MTQKMTGPADPGREAAPADPERAALPARARRRLAALELVREGSLSKAEAARRLGLSRVHIYRLLARLEEEGPSGLLSRRAGKPPNSAHGEGVRQAARALCADPDLDDFSLALMAEVLERRTGARVSPQTLGRWQDEWGLRTAKRRKPRRVHPSRPRRERAGELVQIDGSHHDWFEGRGERCVLIVFIDDATGRTYARFFPGETSFAYMESVNGYISLYGVPAAVYHDRHSIFTVGESDKRARGRERTQFGEMLAEIGVASICATTPQAKGRVERFNRTAQDRLVKELRLAGISGIDSANRFLEEVYLPDHNRRFAVAPADSRDAHRPDALGPVRRFHLASERHVRVVDEGMCVSFGGTRMRIRASGGGQHIRGRRVDVRRYPGGDVRIWLGWREKAYDVLSRKGQAAAVVGGKGLNAAVDDALAGSAWRAAEGRPPAKPGKDHPWRDKEGFKRRARRRAGSARTRE